MKRIVIIIVVICILSIIFITALRFGRNSVNDMTEEYEVLYSAYKELQDEYDKLEDKYNAELNKKVSVRFVSRSEPESTDDFDWEEKDIPKDCVGYILIPSCDIGAYVRHGTTDWALTEKHVGEYEYSGDIGIGNYVVLGHARDGKDYVFTDLKDNVELGDIIYIQKDNKVYAFEVSFMRIVNPDAVYVMDDTYTGIATCTLICCSDQGKRRFVVFGNLIKVKEL